MPALSEQDRYDRQIKRIRALIVGLGIGGTAFVAIRYGWQTGVGFLVGAIASYLSVVRWRRIVESIGQEGARPKMPVFGFIVQFGLITAVGYVIFKYLELNRLAAGLGLLVGAAAVTIEILYQLLYGA